MFHGRDVRLYEALSRSTGVHVVASTGMGPEELLGGYFRTPQTDPPTPWPAERFADLFAKELTEGMVVPRVERRGRAGLVVTAASREGMTATDESLLRGAARAATVAGVPVSLRHGRDPLAELEVILDEGLGADRVVVGGLDRRDAAGDGEGRGAGAAPTSPSTTSAPTVSTTGRTTSPTRERVALVLELVGPGLGDRVLLSSSATGCAFGHPATDVPFGHVLTSFAPALAAAGLAAEEIQRLLVDNPAALLARAD